MKKNNVVCRVISALLAGIMLMQVAACQKKADVEIAAMEIEEVDTFSYDFIGGTDVMPIVGYYGPTYTAYSWNGNLMPDYFSDEIFELIKETGVNAISYNTTNYARQPEKTVQLLKQGEKYNIGIHVYDSRIAEANGKELTLEIVDQIVNEYANYPAYLGNFIMDEPSYSEFNGETENHNVEDAAPIFQKLNQLGFYGYGNLFPMGVGTIHGYYKYIRAIVDQWKVPYLSYDFYPFQEKDGGLKNGKDYFNNMSVIREVAEESNIPFWTFIEAGWQHNDAQKRFDTDGYYPSQGETYWSVGTSLAFGAKGIQYFTLIQPAWFAYAETEAHDFQRNGLIGADGSKTRWFYYAKDMNAQIAAVDQVLMNSVNKGVIASGESANEHLAESKYLLEGKAWRELVDVKGDAMIGCFNYNGKTALYVVNYDTEYAQKITLNFADTYNIAVTQDAKESHLSRKNLELALSAGNSALIVFE